MTKASLQRESFVRVCCYLIGWWEERTVTVHSPFYSICFGWPPQYALARENAVILRLFLNAEDNTTICSLGLDLFYEGRLFVSQ